MWTTVKEPFYSRLLPIPLTKEPQILSLDDGRGGFLLRGALRRVPVESDAFLTRVSWAADNVPKNYRSHRPLGLALVFATLIGLHHTRPEWLGVEGLKILHHIPLVGLYAANSLCWVLGFTLIRPDTH